MLSMAAIMLSKLHNVVSELSGHQSMTRKPPHQSHYITIFFLLWSLTHKKTIAPIVHPCNRATKTTTKWAGVILRHPRSSERGCKKKQREGTVLDKCRCIHRKLHWACAFACPELNYTLRSSTEWKRLWFLQTENGNWRFVRKGQALRCGHTLLRGAPTSVGGVPRGHPLGGDKSGSDICGGEAWQVRGGGIHRGWHTGQRAVTHQWVWHFWGVTSWPGMGDRGIRQRSCWAWTMICSNTTSVLLQKHWSEKTDCFKCNLRTSNVENQSCQNVNESFGGFYFYWRERISWIYMVCGLRNRHAQRSPPRRSLSGTKKRTPPKKKPITSTQQEHMAKLIRFNLTFRTEKKPTNPIHCET